MTLLSINKHSSEDSTSHAINGTAWLTAANLITMILGLILVMIATRVFAAATYGDYILLTLMSGLLSQLTTLGMGVTSTRFIAISTDSVQKESLVNTVLTLRFIIFGITALAAWIVSPFLFKLFGGTWKLLTFGFVIMLFFVDTFTATMQAILQGFFRFKQIAIWDIASSLLNLILLVILIKLNLNGVLALVAASSIAYGLTGIYMFVSIPVKKRLLIQPVVAKGIIKFGYPLQINDILSYFYSRIDTLMIAALLAPANIAYFEIARKIPDSLLAFFDSFVIVFFPLFSRLHSNGERQKAEALLRNALRVITFISLCIAAGAVLFGRDIIRLLFSEQYMAAAPVFIILAITLSFILIGYLLGKSLVAVGESDKPAKVNVVHAAVSLLSNWLLIPPFGIMGAGITQLLGPIVTNPLNYFFLKRKFPVRITASYVKPLSIFIAWAGLVFLIPGRSLTIKVAELIAFVLLNILFSVIIKEDIIFLITEIKKILKTSLQKLGEHSSRIHNENISG